MKTKNPPLECNPGDAKLPIVPQRIEKGDDCRGVLKSEKPLKSPPLGKLEKEERSFAWANGVFRYDRVANVRIFSSLGEIWIVPGEWNHLVCSS